MYFSNFSLHLLKKCTSFSRLLSNSSRKWVMAGSPSKSLKWLFTHSKTTRVTWENHMISTCWYPWQQLYRVPNSKPIQEHLNAIKKLFRRTAPPCWPYLVPETWVVKPFQELLSHDHGAGEEGPVGQQEVLDVGRIHHWVLLHQVHGETLRRALIIQNEDRRLQVDRAKLVRLQKTVEVSPWWQYVLSWCRYDPVHGVPSPWRSLLPPQPSACSSPPGWGCSSSPAGLCIQTERKEVIPLTTIGNISTN